MAGVSPSPSKGGKRELNADLNLVPFIDLLSMCICFLLMTAVWMEIGAVNVKQLVGSEAPAETKSSFEMDVRFNKPEELEVNLKHPKLKGQKFSVTAPTAEARLAQLKEKLKALSSSLGAAVGIAPTVDARTQMGQAVSVARVTTKAGVSYGEVVSVMDALRDLGIVSLGLVPVRE